jgi:hypothetical protein
MTRFDMKRRLTGGSEANSVNKWFGGGFAEILTSYESIQTVTLSSNQTNIQFTSIPQTYKHLQIRGIGKSDRANIYDNISIQFNGDTTTTDYTSHLFQGDGAGISIQSYPQNIPYVGIANVLGSDSVNANLFGAFIIDILDYTNVNKYKATRTIGGVDNSGSGVVGLTGGLWNVPDAISSIFIKAQNGTNLKTYTNIALYGIKVA